MSDSKFTRQYPELQEKLILNIDDNHLNHMVLTKILENAGVTTVPANNGAVAIKKLQEGLKPDVILLDLEMPVMNGLETAEFIRKQIDAQIPIIINSGAVSPLERWKLKGLGILEFLEKPYSIHDILRKLSKTVTLTTAE